MGDLDELRGEGWRRLLAAARRRLDKTGGETIGFIGLTDPSDEERLVVNEIVGPRRGEPVRRPTISMAELDRALRQAYGVGLLKALASLDRPDRPVDQTGALGEISRDGTVARLVKQGDGDLLGRAAAVLDRLPARDVPLPVLAEWATGDASALSGTPLAGLVLRALVLWQGAARPSGREAERHVWNDAGVVVDDMASQVLVLNLHVREGHMIAGWLEDAASSGIPFRLTLHQLMAGPLTPDIEEIFVCESAAVLRAAAAELAAYSLPLVCAEGPASVACHRLLGAAVGGGARVRWRNDFDWPGLRMTDAATQRYAASPWRMGAGDYREAARAGGSEPLEGTPAASPWDERLAAEMARERRAVREERLLPALLADLRR